MDKKIVEGIDISPLLLAYEQFQNALKVARSDLEKAGTIQYFEFTYELAWKTMQRILKARGKIINSPRPVFREAAQEGLIDNPESWFLFLNDRNDTVHTYDKAVAAKIFSHLKGFDDEVTKFIKIILSI